MEHKRGPTLVALVGVDTAQVKTLLQTSGVGGLFWEPLSCTVGATTLVVRWIEADDHAASTAHNIQDLQTAETFFGRDIASSRVTITAAKSAVLCRLKGGFAKR